jgi:hypothetical protein
MYMDVLGLFLVHSQIYSSILYAFSWLPFFVVALFILWIILSSCFNVDINVLNAALLYSIICANSLSQFLTPLFLFY